MNDIVRGDVAQLPVGNIQALGVRAYGALQGLYLAAHNALILPFASQGTCALYDFDNLKRLLND